jgi:hypothetical protein
MKRAILITIATTVLATMPAPAEHPDPEIHGVFEGEPMYTLLPPDAIPAIRAPEYVTGEDAAAQMSPEEPVIGLARDGDAICWSAWQLDHHEIVNDQLAGTAIAATW